MFTPNRYDLGMGTTPSFRCTFSLPAELAAEISQSAQALGVSQSALVTEVLSGPLGRLAMYLSLSNPQPSDVALRRRGESRAVLEQLVRDAISASVAISDGLPLPEADEREDPCHPAFLGFLSGDAK